MPDPRKAPTRCWQRSAVIRRAFTLTEVVAAAGLLIALIAVFGPLSMRGIRLLHTTRHHALVIDEISNQLDRLMALVPPERDIAIDKLSPSAELLAAIPSAQVTAEVVQEDRDTRLIVSVDWDRVGNPPPVSLVGWLGSSDAEENR